MQVSDIVIDQAAAAGPSPAHGTGSEAAADRRTHAGQELCKLVLQSSRLELSFEYLNDSYCANRSKIIFLQCMMWCNQWSTMKQSIKSAFHWNIYLLNFTDTSLKTQDLGE